MTSTALLRDVRAWDAASTRERHEVATAIDAATTEFSLRELVSLSDGALEREVAVFVHERTDLEFVLVPGGKFTKTGWKSFTQRYEPQVVTVEHPFLLSRTELAWVHWERVNTRVKARGRARQPVYDLSATAAAEFCRAAGLDMPTSRQWEHACRAGRPWSEGDAHAGSRGGDVGFDAYSVTDGPIDALGLFGMHAGVAEWCRNDLSRSGRAGTPRAYEESGGSYPYVQRSVHRAAGCDGVGFSEPPANALERFDAGYDFVGVRPSRELRVQEQR